VHQPREVLALPTLRRHLTKQVLKSIFAVSGALRRDRKVLASSKPRRDILLVHSSRDVVVAAQKDVKFQRPCVLVGSVSHPQSVPPTSSPSTWGKELYPPVRLVACAS
jgi:hypothetical protein